MLRYLKTKFSSFFVEFMSHMPYLVVILVSAVKYFATKSIVYKAKHFKVKLEKKNRVNGDKAGKF